MVIFGARNTSNTGHHRHARLLHPRFRACYLLGHFGSQQHCLGLDRGTCRLGHELHADPNSAEHLRWHHWATGAQDFCEGFGHDSCTLGVGVWYSQEPERANLEIGGEPKVREPDGEEDYEENESRFKAQSSLRKRTVARSSEQGKS